MSKPYADQPVPKDRTMGLYLHVPFCMRKCPYCSFFSVTAAPQVYEHYIQAILKQAEWIASSGLSQNREVETFFAGGGTPSILEAEQLAELWNQFCQIFPIAGGRIETSVEVNPATVNLSALSHLYRAGYNRISIGVQSLCEDELQRVGRPHSAADAIKTLSDARSAGFANCNLDLMYGLPGQTTASWQRTLKRVLDLEPDHLSIYELTIEKGTPFDRLNQQGHLDLPSEDEVIEMIAVTEESVLTAGLQRYEISNYARPGKECRHNITYWKNGCYAGLGPGAVSYLSGCRYTVVHDIEEYCQRIANGEEWWSDCEKLDRESRFRETVVMGLRMTEGISRADLFRRFGMDPFDYYGKTLECLTEQNLIECLAGNIRLTRTGMNLANQVMVQLV